jgi:hypothetical protein
LPQHLLDRAVDPSDEGDAPQQTLEGEHEGAAKRLAPMMPTA